MNKVHQIIEDVLTVALYDEKSFVSDLKHQIETSLALIIPKRTSYKRAVVRATVSRFNDTAKIEVNLFDSNIGEKIAARVEYVHPAREAKPIKSRKL